MAGDRWGLRGLVLCEDRRTERFIRQLLITLGYDKRKFTFDTAPDGGAGGAGAGQVWVLRNYAEAVNALRTKNYQRLCLIAVRDGDNVGVDARKAELADALRDANMPPRQVSERIATPVPTWEIENWLLDLLQHPGINEHKGPDDDRTWKKVFERTHGPDEARALVDAARAWRSGEIHLPSLGDGRAELDRLDQ